MAALVRVSLTNSRKDIYVNVSQIEPIFHLETLTGPLDCSDPEKKWFRLLIKLARTTVVTLREPDGLLELVFDPFLKTAEDQLWPTLDQAQDLRHRLIRVLESYKCVLSLLTLKVY